MKKSAVWLLKIILSVLAIVLLSNQIQWSTIWQVILQSNGWFLFLALVLYILSKVISAYRLNQLQYNIGIRLSELSNTKLYFIGMFYNLFLPGGIGGDGYKAVWLKNNVKVRTKQVLSALFVDRLFGLAALLFLLFIGLFFTNLFEQLPSWAFYCNIALLIFALPVTVAIVHSLFPDFRKSIGKVVALSLLVQFIQLIEATVIIIAIGLSGSLSHYLVLFLASSVAAVLPISVGGVGIRELTFVYGNDLLHIQKNEAVAFSLIFFVLTVISSFIGVFFRMKSNESI